MVPWFHVVKTSVMSFEATSRQITGCTFYQKHASDETMKVIFVEVNIHAYYIHDRNFLITNWTCNWHQYIPLNVVNWYLQFPFKVWTAAALWHQNFHLLPLQKLLVNWIFTHIMQIIKWHWNNQFNAQVWLLADESIPPVKGCLHIQCCNMHTVL